LIGRGRPSILLTCRTAALSAGKETQAEYGNLACAGGRRDPATNDRQARENRKVAVPHMPRRGERVADTTTELVARHEAGSGPQPLPRSSSQHIPLPRDPAQLPVAPDEIWSIVDDALPCLGLSLSDGARAALESQLRLMQAWNEHINLTALRSPEQVGRGHLLDSLSGVGLVRRLHAEGRRRGEPGHRSGPSGPSILDLGSGAGYPGLPLAVAVPAARCALVDSVGKKHAFLEAASAAATAALAAHAEPVPTFHALAERAEDLADEPEHRGGWDFVVARAVGSLAEVVELGLPLLRLGGHVVAWKREPEPAGLRDEINAARRVVAAAGGDHPFVVAPDREGCAGLAEHRLVVIRKVRPTPDRYPRPPAERRRSALR
jgi:16S rRNA (guanine527-N7)-methyltransferase